MEMNPVRNFKNKLSEEENKFQIAKSVISNGMKKIFFCLATMVLLLTGCAGEETKMLAIPDDMEVTKLARIIENPADYDGKKVLLEGVVGRGCLRCPSDFPYQEGTETTKILVKGFRRPRLKRGQPIRVYAEAKAGKERVVFSALAMEIR